MPHPPSEPGVGVLGPVTVAGPDGEPRAPRSERASALLVALALAGSRAVPVTSLVDDLWTDGVPADPRAALQSLVSRLRATAGATVVVSRPGGYVLGVPSDLALAERGLAAARAALARGEAADAAAASATALARWRGEPGGGLGPTFDGLSRTLATAADRLRDDLVSVRRQAAAALGDHETVVALATDAFEADPTDEVAARDLITALAATGRSADAARAFTRLRHALVTELGTDPSPELEALVRGLESLPPATPTSTGTDRRAARGLRPAAQPLLGRDDDITAVLKALDEQRLVTILGAGGLGKTRLALEVARRVLDDVPAGEPHQVVVAELAGVRTDDDVVLALADALGIAAAPSARLSERILAGDVREQLLERVRSTPTLLVLDNCEHVVAGAAAWTAELLAAAPGLRVLTTSRAPLELAEEQVYAPAPLEADGAGAELFRRRATAARPGVRLPADVVVRLVERLDGLPLAIELAAARVRTLSVEEIEAHLDERFALLRGGDRSAPERQRTLEAVIDWSWNLLEPAQRELWRRVAVLPDGFTAHASAVVGRLDPSARPLDVLDDLDALVSQSIVSAVDVPGGTRYRMLETVRELGIVRLDAAGEEAPVRSALWAWAVDVADRCVSALLGPGQVDALRELEREQENLLFALRTAAVPDVEPWVPGRSVVRRPDVVVRLFIALSGSWALHGSEERAARLAAVVGDAVTWWAVPRADRDRAALAMLFGAMSRALERGLGQARLLARLRLLLRADEGDAQGQTIGLRTRVVVTMFLGNAARTVDGIDDAVAALSTIDDPVLAFAAQLALAQGAENDGRLEESVHLATLAYEAAAPVGDVATRTFAAMLVASSLSEDGRSQEAVEWSVRARAGLETLGSEAAQRLLDWVDLTAALDRADYAEAERICAFLEAIDDSGRQPLAGTEQRAVAEAGRAEIALARGDAEEVFARYRGAAEAVREETGPSAPWAIMVGAAGSVRLAQAGRAAEALETARDAARRAIQFMHVWIARSVDRPVLGTACVGLGVALAVADTDHGRADAVHCGLELLCLGDALGARQDLQALRRAPLFAAAEKRHGAAALAAARERVAALDRADHPSRAFELLAGATG
ncbi:AfsR/SARP family transcriptional regulator [Xylanimonas sp. McL0601]|uniref:AfsR/SARP family transcriptional regulator n=1 Tax=Xylanimonas sp. McL0601 TaxID=3414739 RepID=UPI003CEA458A